MQGTSIQKILNRIMSFRSDQPGEKNSTLCRTQLPGNPESTRTLALGKYTLIQVQIQMHKDGQINLIFFEEHFLRLCRFASFGIHKDKEKHIKISKCGSHLVLEHIIANEMKRKTVSSLLTRQ